MTSTNKSDKELAFLRDLYVSTDWGERFAQLIDEHIKLPKTGRVLYAAAGTGDHALALLQRAGRDATLVATDESASNLELARAKAAALKSGAEFRVAQLEALDFEDEAFDLVICDASMIAAERLPEIFAEIVRVAAPGGAVAFCAVTASSFGEFFSIYWEALINTRLTEHASAVESLLTEHLIVADLEARARSEGLDEVQSWTNREEFPYESGEAFLTAPLINDFLMRVWLEPLPDMEARERVSQEIARIIDEEYHDADFILSIKATLLVGRKAE
ncbi:MAG: class I SAM-dependent methyltransferase [Pyrinomonadaceae bacterium]